MVSSTASSATKWEVIQWVSPFGYDGIAVKCPDCGEEFDDSRANITNYKFCPMCGKQHKGIKRMEKEVRDESSS